MLNRLIYVNFLFSGSFSSSDTLFKYFHQFVFDASAGPRHMVQIRNLDDHWYKLFLRKNYLKWK